MTYDEFNALFPADMPREGDAGWNCWVNGVVRVKARSGRVYLVADDQLGSAEEVGDVTGYPEKPHPRCRKTYRWLRLKNLVAA